MDILNPTDLRLLYILKDNYDHKCARQHDLAFHLCCSREYVSKSLQRLVEFGVINRRRLISRPGRPYIYEVLHHVLPDATSRKLD